jgi:hypothetical protein
MRRRRRAGHFLLNRFLAGSPPNEAIVAALEEAGLDVDLFAPGAEPGSGILSLEYGYGWIAKNVASPRWRRYDVFSGTSEDPMAIVGVLSRLHRKPSFCLADEIFSGSYSGDRPERWKALCRSGMRRSRFTIVNDPARVGLQREYAGLSPSHPVVVFPGCFREAPAAGDRHALRERLGIPHDAFVACYSGVFNLGNGGLWMVDLLEREPDLHVWGQLIAPDPLARGLLGRLRGADRMHLEETRLGWREAWSSMAAADAGIVVYLQDGPQFRNMGISSNRLCMFLSMGVPVVASRQPSFEFVERYECGVLVDDEEEFVKAFDRIRGDLPRFRANALRCAREHIRASERYEELKTALGSVLPR